jgi:gamma-glutamyltranspeptidase/glutathione hydrolase
MEQFTLAGLANVEYESVVAQAMQLALSDRSRRFGSREESAARLTSQEFAIERAREVGVPGPPRIPPTEQTGDLWWLGPDQDHTTHFSVVDRDRMVVTMTQSLGPSLGTRLAVPGVGFLFATRLGTVPGSRPASTISPTIVMDSLKRPQFVLGAAGDSRIITAVIQTIGRVIDQRMSLVDAVAASRVHPMGRTALRIERDPGRGWNNADLLRFGALGFQVDTAASGYFARVHAIGIDHDRGILMGVAEPRGAGSAVGPMRAPRAPARDSAISPALDFVIPAKVVSSFPRSSPSFPRK